MSSRLKQNNSPYRSALIFITSLFFLWGFITVLVDSLIPRAHQLFTLTHFQSGLLQLAFFGAYLLLSIPAGFLLSRIGYKRGIVFGLLIMAAGCLLFYPAAEIRTFSIFILACFVLAAGITLLQVAANPYVAALGPESSASSRLNLSQAFNSLGTAIAPAVGAIFILSDTIKTPEEIQAMNESVRSSYLASEASAVQIPFVGIAIFILLLSLIFQFVQLPDLLSGNTATGGYRKALKHRNLTLGALGIFVYVGAEVALGSYMVNYFMDMNLAESIRQNPSLSQIASLILGSSLNEVSDYGIVGAFITFYWTGAMIGRFIGAYLTSIFKPSMILGTFALGALSLVMISMNSTGILAMISILAVGLFNSILFPTIFTLSLKGLGELKPQASGILCTMIVGGAIIPPLYGKLTDSFGFKVALILVVLCYGYIFLYSKLTSK